MPRILPLGWQTCSLASKQQVRVAKTSNTKIVVPTLELIMVLVSGLLFSNVGWVEICDGLVYIVL